MSGKGDLDESARMTTVENGKLTPLYFLGERSILLGFASIEQMWHSSPFGSSTGVKCHDKVKEMALDYILFEVTSKMEAGISDKFALAAPFLHGDVVTTLVVMVQDNRIVSDQPN